MRQEIQLKGPAGIAFFVGVCALLGVHWFWPGLLPGWLGDTEMSYSLFRSGRVSMTGRSSESHLPGFGGRGDYESGWIPTLGGEELVIARDIAADRGRVTLRVGRYDWSFLPRYFWGREVTGAVNDVIRVPLPEAGIYALDVEHWRMNGRLAIDWSVRSREAD